MKKLVLGACVIALTIAAVGQDKKAGIDIDVQHYRIDAELIPAEQKLKARAEVTYVPKSESRSVVFEMNGSLHITKITMKQDLPNTEQGVSGPAAPPKAAPVTKTAPPVKPVSQKKPGSPPEKVANATPLPDPNPSLQFVQDNKEAMNVRIDLGTMQPANKPITLVFEYDGALDSPQGGPIPNTRIAFVGNQGSYLYYAARWYPFHEYAADRSTYQISITVPQGITVVGYSDQQTPGTPAGTKTTYNFSSAKPMLAGNFAAAQYIAKQYSFGGLTVDVYAKVGDEKGSDHVANVVGKHLEYYSSKFGPYSFGNHFIVAEVDEDTLEAYTGAGILFLNPKAFSAGNTELLARETAYQWWGQAVGIKSFDDAWLMQGLAQFSGLLYIRDDGNESQFQQAIQAEVEKALAFEQSASIRNAPKQLDDQTAAYRSVVYFKGAVVLNMLRQLMGEQKFDSFLKDYYAKETDKNVSLDDFETLTSKAAGRNLRSFFGQWVDSTGVPEFKVEYRMLRNKEGFRVPGTVKQDVEAFEMPLDIVLKTEAGTEKQSIVMKGTSADFDIQSKSKPLDVIIDPESRVMHNSDELRQAVVVRRGIEHMRESEFIEAEQQFNAAIKLNRGNSWAWYNLGLLCMLQRNYQKALDSFDQALNGNLKPDWVEVWSYIYRGNAWDAIDQRERAITEYDKAINNGSDYDNAQAIAQKFKEQKFDPKAQKSVASN